MKTFVRNEQDQSRAPFLRGILIRNLLDHGLPFEDAFELANDIRDELAEVTEIGSKTLRKRVAAMLEERSEGAVLARYLAPAAIPADIQVTTLTGAVNAFSRRRLQRDLQSSALRIEEAEQVTAKIYQQLLAAGIAKITTCQIGYLTYLCLQQELGKAAARQYLVWSEFQRSGRPLLLLISGAVGTGKSSIANEVGHRLEIVRTQSTDMLREVMRSMVPRRLLPILHCSSFDAWKTLPVPDRKERDMDQLVADGYRIQAELVALGCEAVLLRAVREGTSLILEGVHAHPALLQTLPADCGAVGVHVTLAVLRAKELKARLRGRLVEQPERRAKRYLSKFDSIWRLQSFVLSEAERCDTPVIPNDDRDSAIFQIIHTVNRELSRNFSGSPAKVFGSVVERARKRVAGKAWQDALPLLLRSVARAAGRAARH